MGRGRRDFLGGDGDQRGSGIRIIGSHYWAGSSDVC
jgi:hypothetical protein